MLRGRSKRAGATVSFAATFSVTGVFSQDTEHELDGIGEAAGARQYGASAGSHGQMVVNGGQITQAPLGTATPRRGVRVSHVVVPRQRRQVYMQLTPTVAHHHTIACAWCTMVVVELLPCVLQLLPCAVHNGRGATALAVLHHGVQPGCNGVATGVQ